MSAGKGIFLLSMLKLLFNELTELICLKKTEKTNQKHGDQNNNGKDTHRIKNLDISPLSSIILNNISINSLINYINLNNYFLDSITLSVWN